MRQPPSVLNLNPVLRRFRFRVKEIEAGSGSSGSVFTPTDGLTAWTDVAGGTVTGKRKDETGASDGPASGPPESHVEISRFLFSCGLRLFFIVKRGAARHHPLTPIPPPSGSGDARRTKTPEGQPPAPQRRRRRLLRLGDCDGCASCSAVAVQTVWFVPKIHTWL